MFTWYALQALCLLSSLCRPGCSWFVSTSSFYFFPLLYLNKYLTILDVPITVTTVILPSSGKVWFYFAWVLSLGCGSWACKELPPDAIFSLQSVALHVSASGYQFENGLLSGFVRKEDSLSLATRPPARRPACPRALHWPNLRLRRKAACGTGFPSFGLHRLCELVIHQGPIFISLVEEKIMKPMRKRAWKLIIVAKTLCVLRGVQRPLR